MRVDWTRTTVRLVPENCGRVRCEPSWEMDKTSPERRVPDSDLWLVWAGRGRLRSRQGETELHPGVCLWMRPEGSYFATHDPADPLGVTFIHFDLLDPRGRPMRLDAQLPPEIFHLSDLAFADAVSRRIVELCGGQGVARRASADARADVRTATELMTGLVMDLDALADRAGRDPLSGTRRHHHEIVTRLASRITESPANVLPISELAAEAGYSTDHFTRVFQEVLGQSPQAFILAARVTRARQLLAESALSVSQVADALGYESLFYFSRQFKLKTGMAPSEYRRRARP